MATGDVTKDPKRTLTPVPSVNGGTVNRHVKSRSDSDASVIFDDVPDRGSQEDFDSKYTTLDGSAGTAWNETELVDVDANNIWTMMDNHVLAAGWKYVDRAEGPDSYVVTEEPWASEFEDYDWRSIEATGMLEFQTDASLDKSNSSDFRASQARDVLYDCASGWNGWDNLNDDQHDEFEDLTGDDSKIMAAINDLGSLDDDQRLKFGELLAARLWANHQNA
jgi:hypothetical protein